MAAKSRPLSVKQNLTTEANVMVMSPSSRLINSLWLFTFVGSGVF